MSAASASDTLRLMVVDDEPAMRGLLKQALEGAGHLALEAENGQEALENLARESVDLVLTDLRMDGLDGIALLKEIKQRHPHTAVILITGFATLESATEAMRLGAIDVIQKPVNMQELIQKIGAYVEKRRSGTIPNPDFPPPTDPAPAPESVEVRHVALPPMEPGVSKQPPSSIDKILDIPVQATVRLGKAHLKIADLLHLGIGSVVELDKRAGAPVELLINDHLIAMGEVVVVNETFGIRITCVVEHQERIQAMG